MDELELALEDCLQRLASGGANLAQCLRRYPQHAEQLRPMLEAAIQVKRGKEVRPSGAVRDRTRAKLLDHIEAHPRQPRKTQAVPRLALILVGLACALLLAGTGAAQAAMPGQALYGLKLSSEQAWRAAAPNPVAVDLVLADRRANELVMLVGAPGAMPIAAGTSGTDAQTQTIAAYTTVLDRLSAETDINAANILSELEAHHDKLLKAGIHVPRLEEILAHGAHHGNQGQGNGGKP